MTPPVTLTDMLEGLEWQADEGASSLHTTTGDVEVTSRTASFPSHAMDIMTHLRGIRT